MNDKPEDEKRIEKLIRAGDRGLDEMPEIKAMLEKPEAEEEEVLAVKEAIRENPRLIYTKLLCDWLSRNKKLIEYMNDRRML